MNVNINRLLNQTVTVINCLKAEDTGADADEYVSHICSPSMWSEKITRDVDAQGAATLSKVTVAQIPTGTAPYDKYTDYVQNRGLNRLTASVGDIVVLGEVVIPQGADRSTVLETVKAYPFFYVKAFRDLSNNGAVSSSNEGVLRYLNVLHLEGSGIGRG